MRLPRDVSGEDLQQRLVRFGYQVVRQTGSHMRLVSRYMGREHRVTIPRHQELRLGTLSQILREIADYLEMDRGKLLRELFGER